MCGFIAQLVEHRTSIAEVTGSNPVEALIFFSLLSNCLNWKIYCDDHSSHSNKDLTHANKYIKRTRHAIPTLRELKTILNGTKYFSHLVMNDGYLQLEPHFTRIFTRFKRLHFGVSSAAEIFNEEVYKVDQRRKTWL